RNLPVSDENVFLVASAIVPGKNMELNEGIRLLGKKARINLPLKKQTPAESSTPANPPDAATAPFGPVTTTCTVVEGGTTRTFKVTIERPDGHAAPTADTSRETGSNQKVDVFSPFEGKVELVEINVRVGDAVKKGQVVAAVEAMKAKHDVRSP